jgi:glutamine amidotransferase
MIAIVDYGVGNLVSVANAFEAAGAEVNVTAEPAELARARAVVLPGVGAFGDGMQNLRQHGLAAALTEEVMVKGKPFLGICLGLQLIATESFEHGRHQGLGWIPGQVVRIELTEDRFRVPHIGWNDLTLRNESRLLAGITEPLVFYFVHSYYFVPAPGHEAVVTATTWHGVDLTASLERDNIYATQFHPEKSQLAGLQVIKNFIRLVDEAADPRVDQGPIRNA